MSAVSGPCLDYIIPLATRQAIPAIYPWRNSRIAVRLDALRHRPAENGDTWVEVYTGRILRA